MQSERGIRLGRPSHTPLTIHGSWLPAGALLVAHLILSAYGGRSFLSAVPIALATVAALLVCAVLHAAAHLVAGRMTGVRATSTRVFIFGDVSTGATSPAAAIAGPIMSAVLAGVAFGFASTTGHEMHDALLTLALANAAMAVANLIPVLPFDLGRVVAVTGKRKTALFGGRVVGALAIVGGVWLIVDGPSVVERTAAGVWLALAGLFVILEARASQPEHGRLPAVNGVAVGDWIRPFAGRVDANSTVPTHGGPYAVSDDGRLAGVLPHGSPERIAVRDMMIPWSSDLKLPDDAPLAQGLERLASGKAPLVVVVDKTGTVRGVLDEAAVRERLR